MKTASEEMKTCSTKLLGCKYPPEGGGGSKNLGVQWTSKGQSMNVKADGFLSKNPVKALSLRLFFPQSVIDGNLSTYRGHSVRICNLVCKVFSSQWGHAVGSFGKNLVRYSPVGA